MLEPNPIIIFGPTASGKSDVAEQLCDALDGVIINADSLQIYKGLPLLTAQPNVIDGRHFLYDYLVPDIRCDVFTWMNLVRSVMQEAYAKQKIPIIVGGTGFYIKALLEGIVQTPDIPEQVYTQADALLKERGAEFLFEDLQRKVNDGLPEYIKPEDHYRLVRAWAVLEHTGTPLHKLQDQLPKTQPLTALKVLCSQPRENLYDRINRRFIWMWENGILDEVQVFRSLYYNITNNFASKAIGFEEVCAYLDDKLSAEGAITRSQIRTRQYAKRQITWLRHQFKADVVLEGPSFNIDKVKSFYLK